MYKKGEYDPLPVFSDTYSVMYTVIGNLIRYVMNNRNHMTYEDAKAVITEEIALDGNEIATLLGRLGIAKQRKTAKDVIPIYPFLMRIGEGGDYYRPTLKYEPQRPMSLLERQWLRAVLDDPRMKLFENEHMASLRSQLADVEPLYRQEDIVYYDQYKDRDPYDNEEYRKIFQLLLQSIKNSCPVKLMYQPTKGEAFCSIVLPERLEYSEKDDKFRLICKESDLVFNLARIVSCTSAEKDELPEMKELRSTSKTNTLVLCVYDKNNALERVLFNFAHFERLTEKQKNGTYKLSLLYDLNDEIEIVIRILSMGPYVKVISPESVKNKVSDRLREQLRLWDL